MLRHRCTTAGLIPPEDAGAGGVAGGDLQLEPIDPALQAVSRPHWPNERRPRRCEMVLHEPNHCHVSSNAYLSASGQVGVRLQSTRRAGAEQQPEERPHDRAQIISPSEPSRICRRLPLLRDWSHDESQDNREVFLRGA
jgi:hypothetical protein